MTIKNSLRAILIISCLFASGLGCSSPVKPLWGDEQWSFVVFGDIRPNFDIYYTHAVNISSILPVPDVAVCGGDICVDGTNMSEWNIFRQYSTPITDKMPLYLIRGNHEGNSDEEEAALRLQSWAYGDIAETGFYYAETVRNCRFIFLDTDIRGEEASIGPTQFAWLINELDSAENNDSIKYVFPFLHRPPYPQFYHKGADLENADELHELFSSQGKISVVFVFHEHLFSKNVKGRITYIQSGGAGSPARAEDAPGNPYFHFTKVSFNEENDSINIKTVDRFNDIIENFSM
jgi:3',5'-cyclic AMP phosphodiesterase CpdA